MVCGANDNRNPSIRKAVFHLYYYYYDYNYCQTITIKHQIKEEERNENGVTKEVHSARHSLCDTTNGEKMNSFSLKGTRKSYKTQNCEELREREREKRCVPIVSIMFL